MTSLDLVDLQVLVRYQDDPVFHWHHRLLLRRIEGSTWIASSPDLELEALTLADLTIIALARAAQVPRRVAGNVYMFDPFDDEEALAELRREANRMAAALGAPAAPPVGDPAADEAKWIVADTGHPRFGDEVSDDLMANEATGVIRGGSKGMARLSGGNEEDWVFVERVRDEDYEKWELAKHSGPGRDRRLGAEPAAADANLPLTLAQSMAGFRPRDLAKYKRWPFRGPRASTEMLSGVRAVNRELSSFHDPFLGKCGAHPESALLHEHKCWLTLLFMLLCVDCLDGSNLSGVES